MPSNLSRRATHSVRAALLALVLVSGAARLAGAQHPLSTLPLDDPAYRALGALERLGCAPARVSAFRPYFVGDVRAALTAMRADSSCDARVVAPLAARFFAAEVRVLAPIRDSLLERPDTQLLVSPDSPRLAAGGVLDVAFTGLTKGEYRPLWRDVRADSLGDPALRAILRGRGTWSAGPRFVATSELWLESDRRNDPLVRSKKLRDSGGFLDVSEAYMNGRLGPVVASFGRSSEAWLGEGRESLVLSAWGPSMDRLSLSARWSKVEARALVSLLDDVVLDEALDSLAKGTGSVRLHRAFVAHALAWRPVPRLEINVGETMLFTRRGAPVDFAYFNPLNPLVVVQNDTGRTGTEGRDNVVIFGGARAWIGRATVDGQLIVDDVQVDSKDAANTAHQLGWSLAAAAPIPITMPASVRVSYRRIGSFTYSRGFYSEAYQSYGVPLGSELGPDASVADVNVEAWPTSTLQLSAGAGRWLHGATRIERRPSESPNFHAGESFPSTRAGRPAVQRAVTWNLGAQLTNQWFPIMARVEFARISNVNNQPSTAALYVRTVVGARYAIRTP
ncbi:MAG: hypothetical protein JWO05_2094 [Gemmatimonadetes bacterium]|nr:hypothetical protein [Gemmatimonadota bacterium]